MCIIWIHFDNGQIREGDKSIFDVLKWYNEIVSFLLDYISVSIKDSDVSNFSQIGRIQVSIFDRKFCSNRCVLAA